jgi:hypothetical protein
MDFDVNYRPVRGTSARDLFYRLLLLIMPKWYAEFQEMLRFRRQFLKAMGVSPQEFREAKRVMGQQDHRWLTRMGAR